MIGLAIFLAILGAAAGYLWSKMEDRAAVTGAKKALALAEQIQKDVAETQERQKQAGEILDRQKEALAEQETLIKQIARDIILGNYHPELFDDEAKKKWLRDNEPPAHANPRLTVEEFSHALHRISGVKVRLEPGRGKNNFSTNG
jgi:hypothetical protein